MKKSAISLLICVIMILSLCQSVFAADISAITTDYPDIHITANVPSGTKVDATSIKATLDGKPLKVESAEAEDVSTEWIVLIDTSISSNTYFQAEKDSVIAILKSLGDDDTMKLYYFQEKTFKVLDGTESKEEAEKKIKAIKCNGQDTVFYDAIGTMVDAAEKSKADKKVCIIFSDGVDTLSNSSRESAVEKMKKSKTPIYGYYADSLDKKTSDAFNSFLKNSGGKAESFTPSSAVKQLTDKSSEKTVEINLKAEEPVEANDKAVLSIDMGNGKPIKKEFKSQQWEPQSEIETQTAETESTSDNETESGRETTTKATGEGIESLLDNKIVIIAAAALILLLIILLIAKKAMKKAKGKGSDLENKEDSDNGDDKTEESKEDKKAKKEKKKKEKKEKKAAPVVFEIKEPKVKDKPEKIKEDKSEKGAEKRALKEEKEEEKRIKEFEKADKKKKKEAEKFQEKKRAEAQKKAKETEKKEAIERKKIEAERKRAEAEQKKEEERKAKEKLQFQFYFEDKDKDKK